MHIKYVYKAYNTLTLQRNTKLSLLAIAIQKPLYLPFRTSIKLSVPYTFKSIKTHTTVYSDTQRSAKPVLKLITKCRRCSRKLYKVLYVKQKRGYYQLTKSQTNYINISQCEEEKGDSS